MNVLYFERGTFSGGVGAVRVEPLVEEVVEVVEEVEEVELVVVEVGAAEAVEEGGGCCCVLGSAGAREGRVVEGVVAGVGALTELIQREVVGRERRGRE